jgi:curved DNA-binding protein CbpA
MSGSQALESRTEGGSMKDYYAIMGLPRYATHTQVRAKFRFLAKELHPDKPTGNERAFQELQEAYAVLGTPAKRKAYDLQSKVREFAPKAESGGAFDLLGILGAFTAGKVPQGFVDAVSPVLERKLGEHGIDARAATAEDVMEAIGWLKPKRRKRA